MDNHHVYHQFNVLLTHGHGEQKRRSGRPRQDRREGREQSHQRPRFADVLGGRAPIAASGKLGEGALLVAVHEAG